MSALPRQPLTVEELKEHDRHQPLVVVAVLAMLALYLYLFTPAAEYLGIPTLEELTERTGGFAYEVYDDAVDVSINLQATKTGERDPADERLIIFLVLVGVFLSAYFLPLRLKQPSMVLWFLAAFVIIYGQGTTSTLLLSHLVVYATYHPDPVRRRGLHYAILLAALSWLAFPLEVAGSEALGAAIQVPVTAAALLGGYRYVFLPILRSPKGGPIARTIVSQAPVLTLSIGVISHAITKEVWSLPLGITLFFWQWQRLMVYHADVKAGSVPDDLSVFGYLSIFLSPAIIANWSWSPYVGQAYAYLAGNYLREDKNTLAWSGLKLWAIALLYFLFWHWFCDQARMLLYEHGDVRVYNSASSLIRAHLEGTEMSTPTVLLSTLIEQVRVFFNYGSVLHFTVGVWRIMGYRVDTQYNKWWLATNLVSLWGRFAFHLRQYLVTCFYYPVFFRLFRKRRKLRIFTATLAAAGFGNLVFAHTPSNLLNRGADLENVVSRLERWPYFILLGVTISISQVYLMSRKRSRRPWTFDRWIWTDVLCMYLTMQFFSLIHVFDRPQPNGSLWEYTRLFLKGFGIHV